MMNTTNNNNNNNNNSSSSTSSTSNNDNNNNEERWIISSKRKEVPVIQIPSSPVKEKKSTSPTPAELQGFTAQKFVPGSSYSHLDPAKSENAHAAFNHLQKLLSNNNNTNSSSSNGSSSRIPIERKEDPESSSSRPKVIQQQQQHRVQSPNNSEIPQRQNQAQQIKNNKSTCPERTMDGMPVLQYVRALWNYTAQIPSELSFNANDKFAVLNRQPDGWWYAELLDSNKRTRGLIPGNYMTPA
ncbi:uncharacterized protein BX663DRAFT_497795 [Cokeromyces recurvatus]|uniref:uncharacterized protein n=1 Tax=Cokeromyces recurvatus TaxID=90255 RepID=UPI00221F031D|nr:uncharacterized protein BX663DRAFT_497795 [Cokeromyces recurvatus]KAI7905834.1 hypothetical protein BX663DRAFT_497795 [Cokeromyces recurvatus]